MTPTEFWRSPTRADGDSTKWRLYSGRDIIPAWVADMDVCAAVPIIEAVRTRAEHGIYGYADPTSELIEVILSYFSRRWSWTIEAEWLIFLPGLGPAIHAMCRMADGGGILTPSPIYHVFRRAPELAGAIRSDVPFIREGEEWKLPESSLMRGLSSDTRIMQLCNPHNPNGKVFTRDELAELAEFCLRHRLTLCSDEVHADLILDADKSHCCIASLDSEIARSTITLQSPSKSFNIAGLNFAVAVIPDKELRARFRSSLSGKVITHLNPFGMVAAHSAWGGDCDDWLSDAISCLRSNRDLLSSATLKMSGIEMPHLSSTYLAWLRTSGIPSSDFERHGLGMSPGESFGDGDYMRLNFGCSPSLLSEIIERLGRASGESG